MAGDSGWGSLAVGILAATTIITATRVSVSDWTQLRGGFSSGVLGDSAESWQRKAADNCVLRTSASDSVGQLFLDEMAQRQSVVQRVTIPARSLVVLQSLDSSGTRHPFRLRISICQDGVDASESGSLAGPVVQSGGCQPAVFSGLSNAVGPGAVDGSALNRSSGKLVTQSPSRRVLLPLFTDVGIRDVIVDCRCIYRGEAVTVYVCPEAMQPDESSSDSSELLCFFLDRQLGGDDGTLRTLIERDLGPIADVDGDGHLAVVLTNLDRRTQSLSGVDGRIPVLGCVREADFLDGFSDQGGDILYLSPQGLLAEDGQSLLAHELAHAAVHSRQRERLLMGRPKLDIPGWFHESVAHLAEHKAAGPSKHFRERLWEFRRRPQGSPIVLPASTGWNGGRGGSRAAGVLFLQHSLRPSADVADRLRSAESFEELLEDLLDKSFTESLADWGPAEAEQILLAGSETVPNLSVGMDVEAELPGTAMRCWRTDSESLTIEIASAPEAAMRLSVVPVCNATRVTVGN